MTSDNVFSMFGGGPKKEKKEETDEGADEPSGSAKAQKEKEKEKGEGEVCDSCLFLCVVFCFLVLFWFLSRLEPTVGRM